MPDSVQWVPWPLLNPNWCSGMIANSSKIGNILFKIIFSNTLENIDNKLMGRYDVTSFSPLCGLRIIIISAHFHWLGKWSTLNIALNINVRNRTHFGGRLFKVMPSILSQPGTFLLFSNLISYETSLILLLRMGKLIWQGDSRKFSTSLSVCGISISFG